MWRSSWFILNKEGKKVQFARGDLESGHVKFQELDILLIQAAGLIPTAM